MAKWVDPAETQPTGCYIATASILVQELAKDELATPVLRVFEEFVWYVHLHDLTRIHENHPVSDLTGTSSVVLFDHHA